MINALQLSRVYRPVQLWEEVVYNMWGEVEDRHDFLQRAIEFTSDHQRYGEFMRRVIREWPVSCENALTDSSLNKRAWVGHAACALAFRCPEYIVREAWGHITDEQQFLANKEADRAINEWRRTYAEDRGLHPDVDGSLLSERDSRRGNNATHAIRSRPFV